MKSTCLVAFCLLSVAAAKRTYEGTPWPSDKTCNAGGPGYIITHELLPWLTKTVREMEELGARLLDGLNDGIEKLEPHLEKSPMYNLNRQEYFSNMKTNINKYYSEVYNEVIGSWVNFTTVHERYEMRLGRLMHPYSCAFAMRSVGGYHPYQNVFWDLNQMALRVEEIYYKASGILESILKELAIATKAMASTCVVMISETEQLMSLNKEDYSRLVLNHIEKLAPNFLGSVMRKLVSTNMEGGGMQLLNTHVLAELEAIHQGLQYQLQELHQYCYTCPLMYQMYQTLWTSQAYASTQRTNRRPKISQEVTKIYQNEGILSEVAMSLLTTFKDDLPPVPTKDLPILQ